MCVSIKDIELIRTLRKYVTPNKEGIQRERERMGWTQEVFSEMIDMGEKNLSGIECGAKGVSISTLLKICNTLHVSSDTLLFENTPKNDVQNLTAQLERLSPEQFRIVSDVVYKLMEAFALGERQERADS